MLIVRHPAGQFTTAIRARAACLSLLAGLLVTPGTSLGQAPPQQLPLNLVNAVDLTPEQRTQVKAVADFWTAKFTCESPSDSVEEARDRLLQPLSGVNQSISPAFRFEYAQVVVPPLQQLLMDGCENGNLHVQVNAINVLQRLGADKSLNVLVVNADVQNQKTWQVRLNAARAAIDAIKQVEPRKTLDAARRLRDAALREDNRHILSHQLAALDAADHGGLPPDDRAKARAHQLETVSGVAAKLSAAENNPHPNQLVLALNEAVARLRGKFLGSEISPPERDEMARRMAPALGQMLEFIQVNWEAGQAEHKVPYAVVVGLCEGFLPQLDTKARGEGKTPSTALRKSWDSGDRATFQADVIKWNDVLVQPPYVKP